MLARGRMAGRAPPRHSVTTAETVESAVTSLKRAGRQVQRKPTDKVHGCKVKKGKQLNVLDEQEKASEDAGNDIGGLSNAPCAVRLDVMSGDVENDWAVRLRETADRDEIDKLQSSCRS